MRDLKPYRYLSLLILGLFPVSSVAAETQLNGTINALAVAPGPSQVIYAGTDQGLYASYSDGEDWISLSLNETGIKEIVISPDDRNIMYLITDNNALHKSMDAGKNWAKMNITTPRDSSDQASMDLRTLAIDNTDSSTLYLGTFDGFILKSTDEGRSWMTINPDFPLPALNTLAVHPAKPETLYVGTGSRGVLESMDSGGSWTSINNGLGGQSVTRLALSPSSPEMLIAGTYGEGVFISRDSGRNWEPVNSGLSDLFVYSIAVSANNPGNPRSSTEVYVGVYGGGLFKSAANGDIDWQHVSK